MELLGHGQRCASVRHFPQRHHALGWSTLKEDGLFDSCTSVCGGTVHTLGAPEALIASRGGGIAGVGYSWLPYEYKSWGGLVSSVLCLFLLLGRLSGTRSKT